MRLVRTILVVALLAPAASAGGAELTPYLGWRAGGPEYLTGIFCVQPPCPTSAETGNDWLWGGSFRMPLAGRWEFEMLANRQSTELNTVDHLQVVRLVPEGTEFDTFTNLPSLGLRMTHLHAGLVYSWKLRSFEPYAALGAGFTRLDTGPHPNLDLRPDGDEFSASLAAGLDVPLTGRFGARVESRAYSVDLPAQLGGRFVQSEIVTGITVSL